MTDNLTPSIDRIRRFAPKLVELTDEVLYADVWERPGLSKRDRSLVTLAVLVALGRVDQMPGHLRRAIGNGVSEAEIVEIITHTAFYSGWPTAISAAVVAQNTLEPGNGAMP